jgi:hypothetical protein
MIAVLFPLAQVETCCLDMPFVHGADPYIAPGGRYDQASDPVDLLFIADFFVPEEVYESFALFQAGDARLPVTDVDQVSCSSGFFLIPAHLQEFFVCQGKIRFQDLIFKIRWSKIGSH